MPVSPLDYRYGREAIKAVWSQEGRHARQLEVERALIWAHNQLGRVSDVRRRLDMTSWPSPRRWLKLQEMLGGVSI